MATEISIADKKVTTPPGRISYPHLDKATATKGYESSGKAFGFNLLISKSTDITPIKKAEYKAKVDKWGKDKAKWPERMKSGIIDGDKEMIRKKKKNPKGDFSEMQGMWVLNLKRKEEKGPPPLLDRNKQPANPSLFMAGHYAQASIIAFAFESQGDSGGTGFRLLAARYVMKGEALGQGGDPTEDFSDDLPEEFQVDENGPENYEDDSSNEGEEDFDL